MAKQTQIEWPEVKRLVKKGFGPNVPIPTHAIFIYKNAKDQTGADARKGAPAPKAPTQKSAGGMKTAATEAKNSSKRTVVKKVTPKRAAVKKAAGARSVPAKSGASAQRKGATPAAERQTKRVVVKKVSPKNEPGAKTMKTATKKNAATKKEPSVMKRGQSKERVTAQAKPVQGAAAGRMGGSTLSHIIQKAFRH